MSRRSQDIPIRPRYGIPDATNDEDQDQEHFSRARKTSNTSNPQSYTEIPFLAQFPGAVPPEHTLQHNNNATADNVKEKNNEQEEDEDEEDDEHSKESSCEENKTPKRPNSLHCDSSFPYELEGATTTDGEMRHFVAENLEEKLRRDQHQLEASQSSTPSTSTAAGLLTRHYLQTQKPQVDANVLSDIEIEAQYLAASVDNLTENLCNLLHSISSITADNVEVHKNAVNKLTDSMDANIKCMYTIMAKTEEITKSMKPTEQLGQRIREIKRLVDMLDSTM